MPASAGPGVRSYSCWEAVTLVLPGGSYMLGRAADSCGHTVVPLVALHGRSAGPTGARHSKRTSHVGRCGSRVWFRMFHIAPRRIWSMPLRSGERNGTLNSDVALLFSE